MGYPSDMAKVSVPPASLRTGLALLGAAALLLALWRGSAPEEVPTVDVAAPAATAAGPAATSGEAAPARAPRPTPPAQAPVREEIRLGDERAVRQDVPLEKLLTWEGSLAEERSVRPGAPEAGAAAQRGGGRIEVQHRDEIFGSGSQHRVERELGVAVGVDEERSLLLRGGVQLDQEHSGTGTDRLDARPTVGIEKRF